MHLSEVFQYIRPRENTKSDCASVVWRFIKVPSNGERAVIYGDGEQKRDLIHVLDTARASYRNGRGTAFNGIYAIVTEEMQSELEAEHVPNPLKHYQYLTKADMTKTRRDPGFMPEYGLRSGIRSML